MYHAKGCDRNDVYKGIYRGRPDLWLYPDFNGSYQIAAGKDHGAFGLSGYCCRSFWDL